MVAGRRDQLPGRYVLKPFPSAGEAAEAVIRFCRPAGAAGGAGLPFTPFLRRQTVLELMKLLVVVSGVLALAFMILLALPQCKIREMLMPFVAWGFVALCAAYTLSPIDFVPEIVLGPIGMVDDLGAVILGVATAITTINAAKQKRITAKNDPYFNH